FRCGGEMSADDQAIAIFWFRRDLRLRDNHGLYQALSRHRAVLPVFIFDRNILDRLDDRADRRVTFIHRTLARLQACLRERGGDLYSVHATPRAAFEDLLKRFRIEAVYANHD